MCNSDYHHWSCEFESRSWWGVLDTALCDKVGHWLAAGRWFSAGIPVFSSNESDPPRYNWNIVEILLKHHDPNTNS